MKELLTELYNELSAIGSPVVSRLNKGLTIDDIEEQLQGYPFRLTSELLIMYQWHNGVDTYEDLSISEHSFFSCGWFLPLAQALQEYQQIREIETEGHSQYGFPNRWRENYFPVFSDGGGYFYLVECGRVQEDQGKVLYYGYGLPEEEAEVMYSSVEKLLLTKIINYKEGLYSYNKETHHIMATDLEKVEAIYKSINSDIASTR